MSLLAIAALALQLAACSGSPQKAEGSQSSSDAKTSSAPGAGQSGQAASVVAQASAPVSNPGAQVSSVSAANPEPSVKVAEVIKPETAKPAKSPKIVLASTKLDFGKQAQNKTINRSIVVRNGGKAELAIESVTPSCGCTTVDFPKVIKAGGSGQIKVKVETGTASGVHTKQVTIKSNDPDQPTLIVQFSFDVKG